jgi:DNA-binding beta-propeller fold protein YncE
MLTCWQACAVAAVVLTAGSAHAQTFKQVGTIPIPGKPVNAFGVLTIDQTTGLGYLADKDNRSLDVFDTKTDRYVGRIENMPGPNGIVVVDGGTELWASDNDSAIRVIDLKTGKVTATIASGGKERSNGMAFDPKHRVVIVANSNDQPPFLSLISAEPGHRIVAKIPIPQSGENLERSAYHAPSGTFYTVIPVMKSDPGKGLLAHTDPVSGTLIKLHEIDGCHPHSLSIVSDTTIFMGCSSAHGPASKPGGDMAVFDIPSGKVVAVIAGQGGNGGSTVNRALGQYYHATSTSTVLVVDVKTSKRVQAIPTWPGSRSLDVSQATNRIYLATTAKDGPCGGCIAVFAPE